MNEHEPPIPATATKSQVEPLLAALREGTPNRNRIALQIVKDMLDESSFEASPGHAIPGPVAKVAGKVVDRITHGVGKDQGPQRAVAVGEGALLADQVDGFERPASATAVRARRLRVR